MFPRHQSTDSLEDFIVYIYYVFLLKSKNIKVQIVSAYYMFFTYLLILQSYV